MNDLNKRMTLAAVWMIFLRVATRGLGFISVIILARVLTPADFGLVALATVIIGGLELMSAFSFDIALIQKQEQSRSHYDTAWTITVIFSSVIALILIGLAHPAALFYAEPRLEPIMYVLALGTVIEGFQNIGVVAFRKEMNFRREFTFQVAKKIISFIVTVPLAFWLRNYWALVAGIMAGKICGTTMSYMVHPYRAQWSTAAWADLIHFSSWMFFNNLLGFLRSRASDFIVGKVAGPASLGIFTVSFELSQMPSSELVAPINRAVFPAYVQISAELHRLQQSYLDVVAMIALLAIPAAVGLAVLADVVVPVVLGPQWMAAAPLIRILCIAGAITTLESNIGAAYLALGRPDILTKLFGFYVALLTALLLIFTYNWGVIGAAWACLLAAALNIPVYFGAMLHTLRLPLRRFVNVVWRPISSSLVMYMVVSFMMSTADSWGAPPVLLLTGGIIGGLGVYITAVAALWYTSGAPLGAESAVVRRVVATLKRAREPAPFISPGS